MNIGSVLDILMPSACPFCGTPLAKSDVQICSLCMDSLTRIPHDSDWKKEVLDRKLLPGVPYVEAATLFRYARGSKMAQIVQDFKYRSYPSLAVALGRTLASELAPTGFFNAIDVLLPIPMHWCRKASRGYNQAEMLARGVSEVTGIPLGDNLKAVRFHRTQTRKGPDRRETSMKGYFKVSHPVELEGCSVAVVDDVCTTGATIRNAGEALSDVKGLRLFYLTLASV